ncbi:hypothetical protein K490DRAFT_53718 [Saccharata proteae CBS 121410]|uniref:Uncharacterized protein n=1 Tax=Saccharata proteae CBS 121410 TaxID=1314787 RepID=A0A9P4HZL6_9PEZI|nr:hypothetical protein K490DRAFT_53718 [Saccharata proteae CBS 121410]
MMLLNSALLLLTNCVFSALAANGTCPTFVAKNSISSTYRVNFYANGLSAYQAPPALPANITAGTPSKLAQPGHPGAEFTITNCSSTTQSSCTHGSCYTNYITTAQVTHHDLCLTASSRNTNATFSFLPCNVSTPDTQLFALSQYVNYSPSYATSPAYVEFFASRPLDEFY